MFNFQLKDLNFNTSLTIYFPVYLLGIMRFNIFKNRLTQFLIIDVIKSMLIRYFNFFFQHLFYIKQILTCHVRFC